MLDKADRIYNSSPVWFQNLLVSIYGSKLFFKRYTGNYKKLFLSVLESNDWSDQKKEAYQAEQLHLLVRYCRESIPFYQKLFSEYALHENDITSLSDIKKIPILTKKQIRLDPNLFRSPNTKPFMIQNTSGSTGTPLSLWVDEHTYKLAMALLVNHEYLNGVSFRERRATFAGRMIQPAGLMKPPFSRYNFAENQRLFSSYHINKKTFPFYKKELSQFKPVEFIGYPSAIYELACQYEQANCKLDFPLKTIITNSETLLDWQREKIETIFGCEVSDYYGTAEYVLFAGQNKTGEYSTSPLIGITEILTENQSDTVGKVVATTLTNRIMPLIRYEVGDLAAKVTATDASVVNTISKVYGRVDDYIETVDGRKIGRVDHIFKGLSGIKEAQIIQRKVGECEINIVLDQDLSESISLQLIENMKARTGQDFNVSVVVKDQIPRAANGKFKSVLRIL